MSACSRINHFSRREKITFNVSPSITPESMHGKRFVSVGPSSPSYPFLVIALSVDARLAPAACIIKLPACRNADEAHSHEAQSPHTRSTARHSLVVSLETVHPRIFRPPSAILLRVSCSPLFFTQTLIRHILEFSHRLSRVRMLIHVCMYDG